ncbi:MAG: gluconate 2-dehydrogenase subunit 3 family protein [Bacteroidia bacterium]|nr:gluconate 2-dehydrogenase subunit 3 family protein [Bacteroidia bacterium]
MNRRKAIQNASLIAGATIAFPSLLSLISACQHQDRTTWTPIFLNADQAKLISTLVDIWLPRTDTPGALDVKVDVFIDLLLGKAYDSNGQEMVKQELDQLNKQCQEQFGSAFNNLSRDDQIAFIQEQESSSSKFNKSIWGKTIGKQEPISFYRSLKSTALWAYFSSEEISKNVLNYDPVPGVYQGCIPLSDVGRLWS